MKVKFGTDGVRGIANKELTCEIAYALGRAGAFTLINKKNEKESSHILVGKDTRISCDMLEAALAAGICSVGAHAHLVGVVPTPAVATMVSKYKMDAGIMISASHNPVDDNGIKVFNNKGYKLDDLIEKEIENIINNNKELPYPTGASIGTIIHKKEALHQYGDELIKTVQGISLKGLKVGIDCANGATHEISQNVIQKLGATVYPINNNPNGININENCGSTHMQGLIAHVTQNKLDIGIAFDGDGDRCLVVDSNGYELTGDEIMSIFANYLKKEDNLSNNTMVATVMSNIGLEKMGKKYDINILRADVGDRYVLETMLNQGCNFGGEQSGHFIFLDHSTTGDGILTSLQLLKIMSQTNLPLHKINKYMTVYPQILVNAIVKNNNKHTFMDNAKVSYAVKQIEDAIKHVGRCLIRPSGTEPLVRIMLEGEDKDTLIKMANNLKSILESELG